MEIFLDLEKTLLKNDGSIAKEAIDKLKRIAQKHEVYILTTSILEDAKMLFSIPNLTLASTFENAIYAKNKIKTFSFQKSIAPSLNYYSLFAVKEGICYISNYKERLKSLYPGSVFKIVQSLPSSIGAYIIILYQADYLKFLKEHSLEYIEILAQDEKKIMLKVSTTKATKEAFFHYFHKNYSMGIGDSLKDYDFIQHCDLKVAMKNGEAELKEKCAYVTSKTNQEAGAIDFILEHLQV